MANIKVNGKWIDPCSLRNEQLLGFLDKCEQGFRATTSRNERSIWKDWMQSIQEALGQRGADYPDVLWWSQRVDDCVIDIENIAAYKLMSTQLLYAQDK